MDFATKRETLDSRIDSFITRANEFLNTKVMGIIDANTNNPSLTHLMIEITKQILMMDMTLTTHLSHHWRWWYSNMLRQGHYRFHCILENQVSNLWG